MGKDIKKVRKLYEFLREKENKDETFDIAEIANTTGFKESSVKTYMAKKYIDEYIFKVEGENKYRVKGISELSEQAFIRFHSQKRENYSDPKKPQYKNPKVYDLIEKARSSVLQAVSIYNNPLTSFRSPSYIVLMIIGWTSLFHAIFERDNIDYYDKDNNGYKMVGNNKKTWGLNTCIAEYRKLNKNLSDPVVKNLEFFIEIRNEIEHHYLPAVDFDILGECQALLLNFEKLLVTEFTDFYNINQNLNIPLQISNSSSDVRKKIMKQLQSNNYAIIRKSIDAYRQSLSEEVWKSNEFSFQVFLVPILGNHRKSCDLAVEFIKIDEKDANIYNAPIRK